MPGWAIAIIVVVVVILLIVIGIFAWWMSTKNWFNQTAVKIDEANSGIDVALTKRYDLLTKSVATVKGYAKHEAETLEKVVQLRNPANAKTMQEKNECAAAMSEIASKINLVRESYPDLKADKTFLELQVQIRDVEEHLQGSRRNYNANVSIFNQGLVTWPKSIVARRCGFTKKDFFEAESYKKEDVKIEF